MAIREVVDLLSCPRCAQPMALEPGDRSLCCPSGHVFDVARQGYVNLQGRAQPGHADTPEMVAARQRFLAAAHFGPVADRLLDLARQRHPQRLLDVGTGTGYYLAGLLAGLGGQARGVGLDVSVAAARRAARAHPRLGAVVADAWQVLPIATAGVDLLLNVFAPRNPTEFRRVLVASGMLLTVTPEVDHLQELRARFGLLDIQPGKRDQLEAKLTPAFVASSTEVVRYPRRLTRDGVRDLIAMGPNAFHLSPQRVAELSASVPEPVTVTVAVRIGTWAVAS